MLEKNTKKQDNLFLIKGIDNVFDQNLSAHPEIN